MVAGIFDDTMLDLWKCDGFEISRENHNEIHVVDFDFYNVDTFNCCENSNDILMATQAWAGVHPLLKIIPVEWEHTIPYGLLHSPKPSETVQRFLSAVQKTMQN